MYVFSGLTCGNPCVPQSPLLGANSTGSLPRNLAATLQDIENKRQLALQQKGDHTSSTSSTTSYCTTHLLLLLLLYPTTISSSSSSSSSSCCTTLREKCGLDWNRGFTDPCCFQKAVFVLNFYLSRPSSPHLCVAVCSSYLDTSLCPQSPRGLVYTPWRKPQKVALVYLVFLH